MHNFDYNFLCLFICVKLPEPEIKMESVFANEFDFEELQFSGAISVCILNRC